MKLRNTIASLCLLAPLTVLPATTLACGGNKAKAMMDTINYQVSSESNVETTQAEIFVSLNASIASGDLASIQGQAKNDLNGLIKGSQWTIEDYRQSKTASGLINVTMMLKDRLTSQQLAELTDKIDSIDGKGKQYKLDHINYQPSLAQMQQAKNTLRLKIVADVSKQLKELNKQTGQKYHIHEINFIAPYTAPQPRANVMMAAYDGAAQQKVAQPMQVSTKLVLTANVELAKDHNTK
ncbi:hypothetical protein L3V82_10805 [Thiotrichales bacterium 19S3-7]|nr:hypothetical protein [Thiotrichales bacterium 19S3-7]MCF6802647.1 hypothetical protein [Thiotrichales bacterium 19S3-11]